MELQNIVSAHQKVLRASTELEEAVRSAREAGATWQQIGDSMGISKQAASQRFNKISPPLTNKSLDSIQQELQRVAEDFFTALNRDEITKVHSMMTYMTARQLSKRKISGVWNQVRDAYGDFLKIANSLVEQSGTTFVYTYRLRHQGGETVGQILFNKNTQIIGWVIYLDDSAELPW